MGYQPKLFVRCIVVLLLLTVQSVCLSGQDDNRKKELDKFFSALYKNGEFNGNVLVAEKGRILYERSFGYADNFAQKPNTIKTSFPVASVTKTFTSTAILQLLEKGKLQLTDPYAKYFPDFPYPSVTIKQLLSHTSRIPSSAFYRFLDSLRKVKDTVFTNADVIPAFIQMKQPLVGEPKAEGDRAAFAYSNINYYLLALLIEKRSGMPYGSYLRKNIFIPAGMEGTELSEFNTGMDKNICKEQRYRYLYSGSPERPDTVADLTYIFKTYNFKGHGDITSTTADLLKYDQALTRGILIGKSTLAQAYQAVVPGNPNSSGYALGWSVLHDSTKGKVVLHHGGGLGIEAMFVRNIAKNQVVILFDNNKNPAFDKAIRALNILNGEALPLPKKSIAVTYGRTIMKDGIPAARKLLQTLKKDTVNYNLSENEMNLLGYQFLWSNLNDQSFEVLKTNVELFPLSWNSYDSYGEILLKFGRKEEAVTMYQKSIEMNPQNEGGKKALEQIMKESK